MKSLRPILICLLIIALSDAASAGSGEPAPHTHFQKKSSRPTAVAPPTKPSANYGKYAFTMRSLDGANIRLADHAGKIVLVTIWSPGCEPCERETAGLVKIYNRYHAMGFEILGVAVKTTETDVRAFLQKHGVKWAFGIHDDILNSYGMYGLPDHYLFSGDGSLLKHYIGMVREDNLRPLLDEIFHPKPPPSRPLK
jgi:peroxiredoxin